MKDTELRLLRSRLKNELERRRASKDTVEPDDLYGQIGFRVRKNRKHRGWTQEELAARVKPQMVRTSIVNLEAGRQRPPISTLYDIAHALGVAIYDLLPPVKP